MHTRTRTILMCCSQQRAAVSLSHTPPPPRVSKAHAHTYMHTYSAISQPVGCTVSLSLTPTHAPTCTHVHTCSAISQPAGGHSVHVDACMYTYIYTHKEPKQAKFFG